MRMAIGFESHNGTTDAFVLGSPELRATGSTKAEARVALEVTLRSRLGSGEIEYIDLDRTESYVERAARVTDEERLDWEQLVADIYTERDAEKAAEFPE